MGYLARLAQANVLSVSALQTLIDDAVIDVPAELQEFQQIRGALITRWVRYCPQCLGQRKIWRLGWELRFADACAGCGCWLLDTCHVCGARQTWRRSALEFCHQCGADLVATTSREAPNSLQRLSQALEACWTTDAAPSSVRILEGIGIEEAIQVVRLLGAYGGWDGGRVPQKVLDVDRLDVSWTISTVAAEILCAWPDGFHELLGRLQRYADAHASGRLRGAFGGLYAAIYRGLRAPAFEFLRAAFEGFVAQSWTGAIGRRNRRLDTSVLARMTWVPARAARRMFGVSASQLDRLIADGHVVSVTRSSLTGREFQMVRKEDVERGRRNREDFVTLAVAAKHLGLKRQRLSRILPVLCPEAAKDATQGVPWHIPRSWLDAWLDRLAMYTSVIAVDTTSLVTIGERLRFGGANDDEIARIVLALQCDELDGVGVVGSTRAIPSVILRRDDVRRLIDQRVPEGAASWLRVQDVAEILAVKQEVAYYWVRAGLLRSQEFRERGRQVRKVNVADVHAFQQRYVLARDIARKAGISPKHLVRQLRDAGVGPVSGPGIDQGRQVLFEIEAVDRLSGLQCEARSRSDSSYKIEL